MRVVLVNPPHSNYDVNELGPPLGLLRLMGGARESFLDVQLLDLNLAWHQDITLREQFFSNAQDRLLTLDAEVYGFSSMCVDSHVSLELGRLLKQLRPEAKIIVGGTHFSTFTDKDRSRFPWVDRVIRHEAEVEFQSVLGNSKFANQSSLPSKDYSAIDLSDYFSVNPRGVVDVESARGCSFRCAFCYSPGHYPKLRFLNTERLIRELEFLASAGAKHVFFVEDDFLANEMHARSVCEAIREAGLGLTWHCYATAPRITPTLLNVMASSGCVALFTGVDAVGTTSQRLYKKRFSLGISSKILECLEVGITPTCAFLVAPPSHPAGADAEATFQAALSARELGANIRLNIITYYPRTTIDAQRPVMFADFFRTELELDVPDIVVQNPFALKNPELFPFHARYVSQSEWEGFASQVHILFTLIYSRGQELMRLVDAHARLGDVAIQVAAYLGDMRQIPKVERRKAEVEAFDRLFAGSLYSGVHHDFQTHQAILTE